MKLGEIVRIWGAVDYKPDLRFIEKIFSVGSSLKDKFGHWWTDRTQVMLYDYDRRECLQISSRRIAFEAVNPDDVVQSINTLSDNIKKALDSMGCRELERMGIKLVVYAPMDLTFENIKDQMRPLCLPNNPSLEEVTSKEITDVAMNFDYQWNKKDVKIRVGPMKTEQGRRMLINMGDIARLFPSPDTSDKFSEFCLSIPSDFLYFDIDIFSETQIETKMWPSFVQEVAPYCPKAFEGIKKLILECD
jgi:hypothetical protein